MGRWLMTLLLVMLASLATRAAEAYANYTPANTTLTFYYDNYRSIRTGTTYDDDHDDVSMPISTVAPITRAISLIRTPSCAAMRTVTARSISLT